MGPTKRLIIGVIVATAFSFIGNTHSAAANEETYFITTAYYSPLPGQVKYYNGSYAAEIRMNGKGTHGASGKEVFPGMLAGPANYPFGTKLYFEGYGIAEIADRGGAIVNKGVRGHEYDRIDIWMGYGDEGRNRAIAWGTRKLKGKIVVPSADVTLAFDGEDTSLGYIGKFQINPEKSNPEHVKRLQEFFTNAGLYTGPIDGEFDSIQDALIEFQLNNDIISSRDSEDAGWYGNKTLVAIRNKYITNEVGTILQQEDSLNFSSFNHKGASEVYKLILEYGDLQVQPDSDPLTVVELQKLLTSLGEYTGPLNGDYNDIENTLIEFQIRIGLINNSEDWGAGYFGNKTKAALWEYYEDTDITITPIDESMIDLIEKKVEEAPKQAPQDTSNSQEQGDDELSDDSIEKPLTLSSSEKARIDYLMSIVRERLVSQEKITRKTVESQLEGLSQQITNVLPEITQRSMKAKLLYIQEVIERGY